MFTGVAYGLSFSDDEYKSAFSFIGGRMNSTLNELLLADEDDPEVIENYEYLSQVYDILKNCR